MHSVGLKMSAQASRARIRPATVRSAIFRKWALSLEKAFSIGFELCGIFGDGVNQAADFFSDATSIPSRNVTPLTTFGN